MTHYAGLDVSLEETAICVIDGSGRVVKETRAASEPEALVATLAASTATDRPRPNGRIQIVPVGTMGKTISLRVQSLPASACKVVVPDWDALPS